MQVVFASNNVHKVEEVNEIVKKIQIIPQSNFNIPDIPETGTTFIENAILKAKNAAKYTELSVIADDSGLVVPALKNAPGVYSKRYAGEKAEAKDNIEKLLIEMQGFIRDERRAYLVCVLAYMLDEKDGMPEVFVGKLHGTILEEPKGDIRFGYNAIFSIDGKNSLAQSSLQELVEDNHRSRAFKAFEEYVTR